MSVETETDPQPAEGQAGAPSPDAGPEGEQADAAPQGAGGGPDEFARLRAERDELFARLQRVSAEFDNFQKRTRREREKWSQDVTRGLLGSFLPVLDTIELAVAAFDAPAKDPGALRQGVELVREELRRQLAAHGVTQIDAAVGAPFDADRHQAITAQEDPEATAEVVAFVARAGYQVGDFVIRPAQVGVKKPAR